MGSDDLFKKKRERLKAQKEGFREPKPNSFLIVTEGTKTEPLYFDGLATYINNTYGKSIHTEKPLIVTQGEGKCTKSLVEATEKCVARGTVFYSQVWVLFDKDDFTDFDEAITLANRNGFHVSWSNPSFELWLYLHFNYSDAALDRFKLLSKLDMLFKTRGINKSGYQKNDPTIFETLTQSQHSSLKAAVSNAIRLEKTYEFNPPNPSQRIPCTTVHNLILALKPYLKELFE